jgi:pimeloyl-ACP methyl ester carboxylesterase
MPAAPEPFAIAVPQAELDDLRARLALTRWPRPVPGRPWELGTDEATLRRLVARWADGYDWRVHEARMNELPHFTVDLDGAPVHFVHLRSAEPDPLAIVLTHGWPGSFLELADLGRRLAAGPFDVVIPSLPGFAFSAQRPDDADAWDTPELWHRLMTDVLGYQRYAAHGGDLGSGVTTRLAQRHPEAVVAIHVLAVGTPHVADAATLTAAERAYVQQAANWERDEGGYEHEQQTRPVTLGYGLSDSPVGLLAWIVEKLRAWSDCDGDLATRFRDDDVLTWTSLYWLTNTIATSLRPYSEFRRHPPGPPAVTVPTAVAVFPFDLTHPPREWAQRGYAVARYTRMPRGGHFAAFEEPELLGTDITEFLAPMR